MITYLLISLIFFFLGRYTATNKDVEKAKEVFKKIKKTDKGGVVRGMTPKEERQAKDKEFVDNFPQVG